MDIGQLLQNTLSPHQAVREAATLTLDRASAENFPLYIQLLCNELVNDKAASHIRIAAGVAMKNALISKKDAAKNRQYAERWVALDASLKIALKSLVINAMTTAAGTTGTTIAQVTAAIASVELPRNEWPELISLLLQSMTRVGAPGTLRRTTLETIGFMCEDIEHWVLAPWSSPILTTIIQGARKEEVDEGVRLAAITALNNALTFVSVHFENETERNFLMTVVCEATQSPSEPIAVAAFECLVSIMTLYYSYMAPYMTHGLFAATIEAMRSDSRPGIALQAIEFWSTVCDAEIDRLIEKDRDPSVEVYFFAKAAAPLVLPTLLDLILNAQQEDEADEDEDSGEWTIAKAAITSLSLFAGCVQDELLSLNNGMIFSFIESNITMESWVKREAALMVFASILDGPSQMLLRTYVRGAVKMLLSIAVNDPSIAVRDTASYAISRCCELMVGEYGELLFIEDDGSSLVTTLETLLAIHPRTAFHAAMALMYLGVNLAPQHGKRNALTPFISRLLTVLYSTISTGNTTSRVADAVFQAMSALVGAVDDDQLTLVIQLTESVLSQLEFLMMNDGSGLEGKTDLASNYLMLLQALFLRLGEQVKMVSDRAMVLFLSMLNSISAHSQPHLQTSSLVEDALMAIESLIVELGDGSERLASYCSYLYPKLVEMIKTMTASTSLMIIVIGIVGEITRMLPPESLASIVNVEEIFPLLLALIQSESTTLDVRIKTSAIGVIGDLISAFGERSRAFLPVVQTILEEGIKYEDTDGELREAIIGTWTFIVQAFAADNELLRNIAPKIVAMVRVVAEDDNASEAAVRAAIGALGDLGAVLVQAQLVSPWMRPFIRDHCRRGTFANATVDVACWTYRQLYGDSQ